MKAVFEVEHEPGIRRAQRVHHRLDVGRLVRAPRRGSVVVIEFPDGLRPHQVRLQGGDASSDSFCFS